MTPKFSIIIPVLHEGAQIQVCLQHLAEVATGQSYEVIVVDGDRQGSTLAHLPPFAAPLHGITAPLGRGPQMNAGARMAQGQWLLFLHRDVQLPHQALHQVDQVLTVEHIAGGAFDLKIDSSRWCLRAISTLSSWRSRLTRIPYGDQAIFIKKAVFDQVQGYPDIPIMEDVALMQRLKQNGHTIQILRSPVMASPRRWEQEGILRCTLRNWVLLWLYRSGVAPEVLVQWYRPSAPTIETEAIP
jgi:rSAM/selenodomain-associated transferase 2